MFEVCEFATSLGKVHSTGSDLAADTLSVIVTAKALKLPENRN